MNTPDYGITKAFILLWPLFWLGLGFRLASFPITKQKTKSLGWGMISGFVMIVCIYGVFYFWQDYFLGFTKTIAKKTEDMGLLRKDFYLGFSVFLCLGHAFLEEFYWRFFIFRGLTQKISPFWAASLSSLFFAGHHFIILSQYFPLWITILFGTLVGVGGLIWCGIYYKSNTLLGSWVSHVLVDAIIMFIGFQILF